MLFSRSAEYAIFALGRLAEEPEGAQLMARTIAEDEGMPVYFLAKTLQTLARQGLLRSSKGPSGGFRLNRPPSKIRFLDIVEALDGLDGLRNGQNGLPEFGPVRATILNYLKTMTVADVAKSRKRGRRRAKA